jgi:hypothetical protein
MRVIRGTWKPAWQREGFGSFSEWLDVRGNTLRVRKYFERIQYRLECENNPPKKARGNRFWVCRWCLCNITKKGAGNFRGWRSRFRIIKTKDEKLIRIHERCYDEMKEVMKELRT